MNKLTMVALKVIDHEPRVDSRIIANELGINHQSFLKTITRHQDQIEELGVLRLEVSKLKNEQGGRPVVHTYVNEDQAIFLMTLSKNTSRVVQLKFKLVLALKQYREHKEISEEYIPFYHELHDQVKKVACAAHSAGSKTPQRIFHMNTNKMVNKALGLPAGKRPQLKPRTKAFVTVANVLAGEALKRSLNNGSNHKVAYQEAKQAVHCYSQSLPLVSSNDRLPSGEKNASDRPKQKLHKE